MQSTLLEHLKLLIRIPLFFSLIFFGMWSRSLSFPLNTAAVTAKENINFLNVSQYFPQLYNDDYVDPIETSGQFEGDILLPPLETRNAIRNRKGKWLGGVVPYTLPTFYGVMGRIMIALAVSEFNRNTCIRFVQRTNETDYVSVFRGSGCYSYIGRLGGEQELSLASPCDQMGIVIHEFMHAIGFWHEQSRTDRDEFVTIHWENIASGTESNFRKYDSYVQQTLDEEYDYGSLLHYSTRAFSKNSLPTIQPKNVLAGLVIGQRWGFSPTDIRKINKLYDCKGYL